MLADQHFDNLAEAVEAARKNRAASGDESVMVRVEKSPYGGFRLRSIPVDFWVEATADGLPMHHIFPVLDRKRYGK